MINDQTFTKLKEAIKGQKGAQKAITFDQVFGKSNKKARSAAFYNMLLLSKQDKITMKQKNMFTFGQIEVVIN